MCRTGIPVLWTCNSPLCRTGSPVSRTGIPVGRNGSSPVYKTGSPVCRTSHVIKFFLVQHTNFKVKFDALPVIRIKKKKIYNYSRDQVEQISKRKNLKIP